MQFRHELAYDAPPDRVYAMLADPDFRRASCEAMGVLSADVQLEPAADGAGFTLVVDQLQDTQGLPSFARKFAGDSTRAVQRETWADAGGGTLEIDSPGKPASIAGTIRLEPTGSGTTEVVELDLKVKVPLIGGKLEKLLADTVRTGMDAEHEVGVRWLEKH